MGDSGAIDSYEKSTPSSRKGAPALVRHAANRPPCLGSRTPLTAGRPRLRIPAFSVAIAASVLPS